MLFVVLSGLWIPVTADDGPSSEIKTLRYLMYNTRPTGWVDDQGQAQGIFAHMSRRLVDEVDPNITLVHGDATAKRLLHMLLAGEVDFIYGVFDQRLFENTIMLAHIGAMPLEVWSMPERPLETNLDLIGTPLALVSIFAQQPFLRKSELLIQPSSNPLVKMLLAKRVGGVVGLSPVLEHGAFAEGVNPNRFTRLRLSEINAYLWVSKKSPMSRDLDRWRQAALRANSPQVFDELARTINRQYYPDEQLKMDVNGDDQ